MFSHNGPQTAWQQTPSHINISRNAGNSQVPSYAEVSALWGIAYLEKMLPDVFCDGLWGDEEGLDRDFDNMTMFTEYGEAIS